MFPDSQHTDSLTPQQRADPMVPGSVTVDFRRPELSIGTRDVTALGAAVPKAAINKHREPLGREVEVRSARYVSGRDSPALNAGRS
jgi:hypothetical protein